jgi:sporulation protein YlmC with PRC-barrel domain
MDSAQGSDVMRLTDLRHAEVRSPDGSSLGRVYEVHCDEGCITALVCGAGGFIERLTNKREGRRIPWKSVGKLDKAGVVIVADAASASRGRSGARRPRR